MKYLEGYEGLYAIDIHGNIWSHKRSIPTKLSPRVSGYGYMKVALYKNKTRKEHKVHRLVAQHFLSNIDNKPEVNHINGDKTNNSVANLEWVTLSENRKHAYRIGLNTRWTKRTAI